MALVRSALASCCGGVREVSLRDCPLCRAMWQSCTTPRAGGLGKPPERRRGAVDGRLRSVSAAGFCNTWFPVATTTSSLNATNYTVTSKRCGSKNTNIEKRLSHQSWAKRPPVVDFWAAWPGIRLGKKCGTESCKAGRSGYKLPSVSTCQCGIRQAVNTAIPIDLGDPSRGINATLADHIASISKLKRG